MGRRKDAAAGGTPESVDSVGMTILPGRPLPEWAAGEVAELEGDATAALFPPPGSAAADGRLAGVAVPDAMAGSSVPAGPSAGGQAAQAGSSTQPAQPADPAMAGYPAQPVQPAMAGYPAQPGYPSYAQPEHPAQTGHLGYPAQPDPAAPGVNSHAFPRQAGEPALVGAAQVAGRSWNSEELTPQAPPAMAPIAPPMTPAGGMGTPGYSAPMAGGVASPDPAMAAAGTSGTVPGWPAGGAPMAAPPTGAPGWAPMPTGASAMATSAMTGDHPSSSGAWPDHTGFPPGHAVDAAMTAEMGSTAGPVASTMTAMPGSASVGTLPPSSGWVSPDRPELSPEHVALLQWWAEMIASGQVPAPPGTSQAPATAAAKGSRRRSSTSRRGPLVVLGVAGVVLVGLAALQGPSLLQQLQDTPAATPETELTLPPRVGDLVQMTGPTADEQLQPLIGLGVRPKGVTVTAAYAKDPAGPLALAALASTAPSPADATGQLLEWASRTGATIGKPLPGEGASAGITCAEVTANPVGGPGSLCIWTAGKERGQVFAVGVAPASAAQRTAQLRAALGPVAGG